MNQHVSKLGYVESTTHLLQAIDDGLCTLIGQDARNMVYDYIEKKFLLKKNEIPLSVETLSKALSTLLGKEASNMIEKEIAKEFCRRTGIRFDPKVNLSIVAYTAYVNYIHKFER
jgi:hypothetical protein